MMIGMPIARKHLIDYSKTCYYHCMSRCIGQQFLLKRSPFSQQKNAVRKEWIEQRILLLGDVFALDLLSYSIMDNHTHYVLHVNLPLAKQWNNVEIFRRWSKIGNIPLLCQLYMQPQFRSYLTDSEIALVLDQANEYRKKLSDISVFMSKLNSYIAHRANKEDGRKGHFWDGRFKSQALLDADAVYNCMAYVDLNPIRSGLASNYYQSDFTSLKWRLSKAKYIDQAFLKPIRSYANNSIATLVDNISVSDYVQRLDAALSFKSMRDEAVVEFVNAEDNWIESIVDFENVYSLSAGIPELVVSFEQRVRTSTKKRGKFNKEFISLIPS